GAGGVHRVGEGCPVPVGPPSWTAPRGIGALVVPRLELVRLALRCLRRRAVIADLHLELLELVLLGLAVDVVTLRGRLGAGSVLLDRPFLRATLPLAAPATPAGLGKVAKQLARDGRGLAGRAHPRAAQHLLALRGVSHSGGEQSGREAAVLVAGGVDQPAGVPAVCATGRVDQQAEQALG